METNDGMMLICAGHQVTVTVSGEGERDTMDISSKM
jgi:hypothetical protein